MPRWEQDVRIGATSYRIALTKNAIEFWHLAKKGIRHIGNGSFSISGKGALFNASITHASPRTVEELAHFAEQLFHQKHPGVHLTGHRTWFPQRQRQPPFSR